MISETISDGLTILSVVLAVGLMLYYFILLPTNRRKGVYALCGLTLALTLEYLRVMCGYVFDVAEVQYGTWAGVCTRLLVVLVLAFVSFITFWKGVGRVNKNP